MAKIAVNDIHSKLNLSYVDKIERVSSIEDIRGVIAKAKEQAKTVSIAGGRHAMGGQQFATAGILVDMSKMKRVLNFDRDKGLIEVEAGIQWPELIEYYLEAQQGQKEQWGIAQKQTGANRLSIGGTISANAHGRGLTMRPIVENLESLTVLNYKNELIQCSRDENADLFRLIVGGYGLFGVIASATLRLVPRQKIERIVEIADLEVLPGLFEKRISDGFLYGDFQFAIDRNSDDFLSKGVFSAYKPVKTDKKPLENKNKLSKRWFWNKLALMAHTNKSRAYELYEKFYSSTSGRIYWSDLHQMSFYNDHYHNYVNRKLSKTNRGTEIITEVYVPRGSLISFMDKAREYFRGNDTDLIYGTIRLIEKEDESYLAWAKESWACIIFNLHTVHTDQGIAHSSAAFRHLIDLSISFGGSYYLTYHKFATRKQVEACYPQFSKFLKLKQQYDPQEVFQSDWYIHYRNLFKGIKND